MAKQATKIISNVQVSPTSTRSADFVITKFSADCVLNAGDIADM